MPSYDIEAINACMRKAQDHKPKFGEIGDSFPEGAGDASAYGTLPSSAAVARAVDTLSTTMRTEFEAAEAKLDQVARALDAVVQSLQNHEEAAARRLTRSAQ